MNGLHCYQARLGTEVIRTGVQILSCSFGQLSAEEKQINSFLSSVFRIAILSYLSIQIVWLEILVQKVKKHLSLKKQANKKPTRTTSQVFVHTEWHFKTSSTKWNSSMFFGWWQQNFIPYYFHRSCNYHFSKNRRDVSRIPTLNNELCYWRQHEVENFLLTQALFVKIILTHLLLVKYGEVRRKWRAQGVYVCMHEAMCN